MFELDRHLAQDIVNRAMAILPYNVNVMDRQGVIIGSGDVQRVDHLWGAGDELDAWPWSSKAE